MSNKGDQRRDKFMLTGSFAKQGYDWWWHSFTGHNAVTGEEKGFFFEFFLCNPALGTDIPILGQSEESKRLGLKPSYLMVKAGAWGENAVQLHRFFPWNDVKLGRDVPFFVSASDCFLTETESHGCVSLSESDCKEHPEYMSDFGTIEWNLKIKKQIAYNVGYGAGSFFRTIKAFEMFWHAEGMKSEYEGEVILNGEKYIITPSTSFGYADKNWGRNFTSPWVWLSSNNLRSLKTGRQLENSVFDIGGGRPKVGPVALKRKLLSSFCYEGKEYEFNFSKFWTFTSTVFDCRETEDQIIWHVEQKTLFNRMVTDITCNKSDMLLVNYEAPDGTKRHNRLWNGGNGKGVVKLYRRGKLIDEVEVKNAGCEYGEYTC